MSANSCQFQINLFLSVVSKTHLKSYLQKFIRGICNVTYNSDTNSLNLISLLLNNLVKENDIVVHMNNFPFSLLYLAMNQMEYFGWVELLVNILQTGCKATRKLLIDRAKCNLIMSCFVVFVDPCLKGNSGYALQDKIMVGQQYFKYIDLYLDLTIRNPKTCNEKRRIKK
ncbi:hypothetical protein BpHYR1_014714 [Brachionus plicatilis]|uniref:Uncharacterized protein n=1 Tax=Brachionus plicatilis TaxID=10195 RepID=A0A3M7RWR7_BRAPC|nr:hypothetical protein BpHYR1_014714 [Brachionus plicatilis]